MSIEDIRAEASAIANIYKERPLIAVAFQNHIYGCFVILESIAEKGIDVSGSWLLHADALLPQQHSAGRIQNFDTDAQFSDIGIDYGFACDARLQYTPMTDAYKTAWLKLFGEVKCMDVVETMEDIIFRDLLQVFKGTDIAYFENALDTGALTPEWQIRLVGLFTAQQPLLSPPEKARLRKTAYAKTRRGRHRALTPISRKRVTAATRRRRVIVL